MSTRDFDNFDTCEQKQLLFSAAIKSWYDVSESRISAGDQEASALACLSEYGVTTADFDMIDTIFPTDGRPQPPRK